MFLLESFDLFSSTTILGALYGIALALYCSCARSLYLRLQEANKQRQTLFALAYISLVLLLTTVNLALIAQIIQLDYVNHPNFPGGPFVYETSMNNSTLRPYATANGILDLAVKVMMLAIQVSHRSTSLP